jgi:hypothetical protein
MAFGREDRGLETEWRARLCLCLVLDWERAHLVLYCTRLCCTVLCCTLLDCTVSGETTETTINIDSLGLMDG